MRTCQAMRPAPDAAGGSGPAGARKAHARCAMQDPASVRSVPRSTVFRLEQSAPLVCCHAQLAVGDAGRGRGFTVCLGPDFFVEK